MLRQMIRLRQNGPTMAAILGRETLNDRRVDPYCCILDRMRRDLITKLWTGELDSFAFVKGSDVTSERTRIHPGRWRVLTPNFDECTASGDGIELIDVWVAAPPETATSVLKLADAGIVSMSVADAASSPPTRADVIASENVDQEVILTADTEVIAAPPPAIDVPAPELVSTALITTADARAVETTPSVTEEAALRHLDQDAISTLDDEAILALLEEHHRRVISNSDARLMPPGRLSVMNLVRGKMRHRGEHGELLPSLKRESEWLERWICGKLPSHQTLSAVTISKVLSSEYWDLNPRSKAAIQKDRD